MSQRSRVLAWSIAVVALFAVVAGALARKPGGTLSRVSAPATPADSTAMGIALYERCGVLPVTERVGCYSKSLDSLASIGEVRMAMGTLAKIVTLDEHANRESHVFAHGIGIAGGRRGGDIAGTFAMCDPSSQSGCYHGVIQAYFASAKQVGPDEIQTLCEPFRGPEADRWLRFQCVHGIGHGLQIVHSYNLPDALKDCDHLMDSWDRRSCYGGVFMENIVNFTMPSHPAHGMDEHAATDEHAGMDHGPPKPAFKALDPADPLYPCSIVANRYLVSCYEMQTSAILYHNKGDIGSAAKTCDTAPRRMRYVCYQSLGRDISSYALQDYAKSKEMCSLGNVKYQPWCYFGLVKNFVDINARASEGLAFCKAVEGDANKMKCYEAVGEQVATLHNDDATRRSSCADSEPAYLGACLFGARVTGDEPEVLRQLNAAAKAA